MRLTLRALLLGIGITLCFPSLLIAQEDPLPGLIMNFEVTGIVTAFERNLGAISINDQDFLMANGVNVQSMVGGDPLDILKVGAEVGYVATEDSNGRSVIVDLWVLSAPTATSNEL